MLLAFCCQNCLCLTDISMPLFGIFPVHAWVIPASEWGELRSGVVSLDNLDDMEMSLPRPIALWSIQRQYFKLGTFACFCFNAGKRSFFLVKWEDTYTKQLDSWSHCNTSDAVIVSASFTPRCTIILESRQWPCVNDICRVSWSPELCSFLRYLVWFCIFSKFFFSFF